MENLKSALKDSESALAIVRQKPSPVAFRLSMFHNMYYIFLLLSACGLGGGLISCVDSDLSALGGRGWMIGGGIVCAFIAGAFGLAEEEAKKSKCPEEIALEKEISRLRKRIRQHSAIVKELASVEASLRKLEPQRYGCNTTKELRSVQVERRELITRVLGNAESAARFGVGNEIDGEEVGCGNDKVSGVIFGFATDVTDEFGEGCPLPEDKEPIREWMAEALEERLASACHVEAPVLKSAEEAESWVGKMTKEHPGKDTEPLRKLANQIVEIRAEWTSEEVMQHFDALISRSMAVVVCIVEDEVNIFTKELGQRFPDEFLRKCREMLKIEPEHPVAWYRQLNSRPVKTIARHALFGTPPDIIPTLPAKRGKLGALRKRCAACVDLAD